MKNKLSGLKLNQKFTLMITLLVMIPMAVFSILLFRYMQDTMINEATGETASYVSENGIALQKVVEMCNMSTQTFLNNQELRDFLGRLKYGDEITTMEYLDFSQNNIAMLERMVNSNPYLYHICVYGKNNEFPEMVPILYREERAKRQSWYKTYQSGAWQFDYPDNLQSYSRMNESEHLMAIVSDITDADGEKIGIVEVAVSMEDVFPDIFKDEPDMWACFMTDDGSICMGPGSSWEEKQDMLLEEAGKLADGESSHISICGEDIILTSRKIPGLGGTYIQANSLKSSLSRLYNQRNLLLGLLTLICVMLIRVINQLVKVLLRKFYEILGMIRQVRGGDLSIRVQTDTQDEMGELGHQINAMLDKIEELIKDNINREVLVKNTEIKALQNQINAHFIYNVLESVKMMAEISEEYEISDAVTALGELLRYSMKWVSGTVTIGQELQYIRNYIQLMNLRYDFTIQLSVSLPDFVYDQQIPKMSLQPIIENAICHGIEEQDQDATIYIKAVELGEDYRIEITDSGMGMTAEQLELVEKKIRGEIEVSGGSGNGIGLKNVQDRIKIQFGQDYGLSFFSKEGCYTKVSILLPRTN